MWLVDELMKPFNSMRNSIPGPKAKKIVDREQEVISGAISVKFFPLVPERGEGCILRDVDGNIYIDLLGGAAVANIGYSHPKLVEAVKDQVSKLQHAMIGYYYNVKAVEVAEKLVSITPGSFEKRVAFATSGSEACDFAIKIAKFYTERPWVISFTGACHGHTCGAASLSGFKGVMNRGFSPLIPQVVWAPYAYCYRCAFKLEYPDCRAACADYIKDHILDHVVPADEVAAIIVEPIQGDAGVIVPPREFLAKLRAICDEYGILLVVDESQTGMGRCGSWFAVEQYGVTPDLLVCGEGLASGLPIGAVVGPSEVMSLPAGSCLLTSAANPVMCSAVLATIEVIEEEKLLENAVSIGELVVKRLRELQERYDVIGDVRGKGLMIGVEIVRDSASKTPAPRLTGEISWRAFQLGLILPVYGLKSNVLKITPPLNISEELANKACDIIEKAVEDAVKGRVQLAAKTW